MTAVRNIFLFLGKRQLFTARDSCRVSFSEKKKKREKKRYTASRISPFSFIYSVFFFLSALLYYCIGTIV